MKPVPDEKPDELTLFEPNDGGWIHLVIPPKDDPVNYRHARYKTGHALFTIDGDEIRIPLCDREEKGDFCELMNELTALMNRDRVRFLNVHEPDDPLADAWAALFDMTDGRSLSDALHGYEVREELWPGQRDKIKCFVVEWDPEEYQ